MLKHSVPMEKTLKTINDLKNEICLNNPYFDDMEMQRLIQEAISFYDYAGWNKSMFNDNQVYFLKYHIKRSEAERLAPRFFKLVEVLRKECGMFLF